MEKKEKIKLSIIGNGISFEREIDQSLAGQIMAFCLSGGQVNSAQPSIVSVISNKIEKESVVEYCDRFSPKRNPDKILVFAGYIREMEDKDSFNSGEIKRLFRDAGEVLPANFTRDFKWVIKNGWFTPDSVKKGNFFITKTGLKVLSDGFPKELIEKTKNRGNNRKFKK